MDLANLTFEGQNNTLMFSRLNEVDEELLVVFLLVQMKKVKYSKTNN